MKNIGVVVARILVSLLVKTKRFNWVVHTNMKILSLFTYPFVIPLFSYDFSKIVVFFVEAFVLKL